MSHLRDVDRLAFGIDEELPVTGGVLTIATGRGKEPPLRMCIR